MKLFFLGLLLAVAACFGHFLALDYAKSIALDMAPPSPQPRTISDEVAIKSLQNGRYGFVYENPSRDSIDLEKAAIQAGDSYLFYEKYVEPIEQDIAKKINLVFVVAYVFIALFVTFFLRRSMISSGPEIFRKILKMVKVAIATCKKPLNNLITRAAVRNVETDFLRMKNLHENGLITDEEFKIKKKELQARIQRNL